MGRVEIAVSDGPLVWAPTWTAFDNLSDCRCAGFEWNVGRQSEFDTTDTGTARVFFHDRAGTLNTEDLVGCQIKLAIINPVTSNEHQVFRGHIDDIETTPNPNRGGLDDVVLHCVDIFDFLGGVEMELSPFGSAFGNIPPPGSEGTIFYEDGPVDDRIIALLDDADLTPDWYVVFSGNVDVLETKYDPGDSVLAALRDAADAEFPGIANIYVSSKTGEVHFHGRFARFDPDGTASGAGAAWNFQRWEAATRASVGTTRAQIRTFQFNRPRSRIINSYTAWPRGIPEAQMPGQVWSDLPSIAAYGRRGKTAGDLIVKEHKTNGNSGMEECELYAQFYVNNYKDPRKNIQTVTFKTLRASDPRAAATWEVMCGIDISDILHLWVSEAGLSDEEFYVEGISGVCRVGAGSDYDMVELTPNLTPFAYYTDNVFE